MKGHAKLSTVFAQSSRCVVSACRGANLQIAGGNDMKSEDEIANDWIKEQIPWLKNPEKLISTVNPDDLKSLWKLQNDLQAMVGQPEPGHSFIVGREIFQRALSSGANLMDVYYRFGRLSLLQACSEAWPLEFPWIHDGKIDDAVFKALAIVPMTGLPPSGGGPFPFDVDELIRLIKKESEA